MFKKVYIKNFRGIKELVIEPLNKVNIFVGDNMAAKTSILDALFIAINPNDLLLAFRTNKFRNIDYMPDLSQILAFFNYMDIRNKIIIKLSGIKKNRNIEIYPRFKSSRSVTYATPIDLDKKNELSFKDNDVISSTENIDNKDNIIGLESIFEINGVEYKSSLELLPNAVVETKGDEKFRREIKGRYVNTITSNTGNLCEAYSKVVENKKKEDILKFLKNFNTKIKDINLVSISRNNILLLEVDEFDKAIDINYFGTGLTRALYIYLSFLSGDDIVLIDEIENGLFFSRQKKMWETIREIIKNKNNNQYFITTHSADMIKNLYEVAVKYNFIDSISLFRIEKINEINQSIYYSKDQFKNAINLGLETRG